MWSGDKGEDIPVAWLAAAGGLLHGKELGQLQGQESGPPSGLGMLMVGRPGGELAHGFHKLFRGM